MVRITRGYIAGPNLTHDPTDNAPRNLAALCQRCHMIHDADEHRRRRWLNAYRRRAVADLFAWFEARSILANEGVPRGTPSRTLKMRTHEPNRSEERRGGQEGVSACRYGWCAVPKKTKIYEKQF